LSSFIAQQRKFSLKRQNLIKKESSEGKMSDEKSAAAAAESPADKKTFKDVVLQGLEEKGSGKDAWLW
jgi:hypothetical protein